MSEWTMLNKVTGETRDRAEFEESTKRRSDGYKKRQEGRQHEFTFTDMRSIPKVIGAIDDKHCGYLLYLQCFISFEGGILTNPDRAKTPMVKADIQRVLDLKKTAFYDFFSSMEANGIIYEIDGKWAVNDAYHFRGTSDNHHVIKSFTTKVRELYTARNAKKLGFIYKLLPYIHLETNTVCANPYEAAVEKTEQLSKADIAKLTGVSEKTVYSYLRTMKLGDEHVFAEIRRGNERYYKLNPFIFYRKQGRPDATLREMFRLGFGS